MSISIEKVGEQAPELVPSVSLAKKTIETRNLQGLTASVALVLDYSGSMFPQYDSGAVQTLVNKVLALATQLDDDGQVDLYIFETRAHYVGTIDISSFRGAVQKIQREYSMGSTDYTGAIKEVVTHSGFTMPTVSVEKKGFFGRKTTAVADPLSAPADFPVLALFVTDGMPDSPETAEQAIIAASYRPVFWQFLSIGRPISFLQKLDDMDGRYVDNADYKNVHDLNVPDEKLFDMLLDEYPAWVADQRSKGQVR